ncbi:hypothetical protein GCM10010308_00420 [Streptomyces vinaceusdrappus]|nr:hypothetical protein GCM10010308_00420 [Streptomyces vinaceusdrappus]
MLWLVADGTRWAFDARELAGTLRLTPHNPRLPHPGEEDPPRLGLAQDTAGTSRCFGDADGIDYAEVSAELRPYVEGQAR